VARVIEVRNHDPLVRRTLHRLTPDATRVVSRLFVAGQEDYGAQQSRASLVIDRVLRLSEEEVCVALDDVYNRFVERHQDLTHDLEMHAHRVANRVQPGVVLSEERWRLIGALFSHEFSIESAALTNPSMVPHPDQSNLEEGSLRFVMSVRCIGEGHRSSIGFREGIFHANGEIDFEPPGDHPVIGTHWEPLLEQSNFKGLLEELDDLGENARFVMSQLGDTFTLTELNTVLFRFLDDRDSFRNADATVQHFRMIAERNYSVSFGAEREMSERVLWPVSYAEWRGMEDARFVKFTKEDGSSQYLATYTAFDGTNISQQLLSTDDFSAFETHPIAGKAARGKGMAIFPRKIGGMFAAMSRADNESNWVTFSDHLDYWNATMSVQIPLRPWELIQVGNSGSPIETEAGWLLMTHAVGPMRTYCISASLLDLEDPARVIGVLEEPLLTPRVDERDGYVPNVVYSCGSMLAGSQLVIPYGISDHAIGIGIAQLDLILERLVK
jgi:predicted GH43/DUF377 family glycosyl hydrolase